MTTFTYLLKLFSNLESVLPDLLRLGIDINNHGHSDSLSG
jgi:hypothetical protein